MSGFYVPGWVQWLLDHSRVALIVLAAVVTGGLYLIWRRKRYERRWVMEAREIGIGPEEREQRGRMRALEEALDLLRAAYWRAIEQGGKDVRITIVVRAERP